MLHSRRKFSVRVGNCCHYQENRNELYSRPTEQDPKNGQFLEMITALKGYLQVRLFHLLLSESPSVAPEETQSPSCLLKQSRQEPSLVGFSFSKTRIFFGSISIHVVRNSWCFIFIGQLQKQNSITSANCSLCFYFMDPVRVGFHHVKTRFLKFQDRNFSADILTSK